MCASEAVLGRKMTMHFKMVVMQGGDMRAKGRRHPYFDTSKYQNELRAIQEVKHRPLPTLVDNLDLLPKQLEL